MEAGCFEAVRIDYVTFPDERFPNIGIYYIFSGYKGIGLCREFRVDVQRFLLRRGSRVFPVSCYEFVGEGELLQRFQEKNKQGIRTRSLDGISFQELSQVIANIHGIDFFKKHDWLSSVRVD